MIYQYFIIVFKYIDTTMFIILIHIDITSLILGYTSLILSYTSLILSYTSLILSYT